jgi:nicotinamidase-related amidase
VKLKLCVGVLVTLLAGACDRETSGPRIGVYDNPQVGLVVIDAQKDFLGEEDGRLLAAVDPLIEGAPGLGVGVVYVRSEPGGEFDPRLGEKHDPAFVKRRSDAFSNPDLDAYFRAHEIDHLVLVGARADASIYYTALGATNRGYKVAVVGDAVAARSAADRDASLEALRRRGVEIIPGERVLAEWARRKKYLSSR